MVKVFSTMTEYVDFLEKLPIQHGEKFLANFIPSAFFPKDSIEIYFERIGNLVEHKDITEKLWNYRKHYLQALESGLSELCVENKAFYNLCVRAQDIANNFLAVDDLQSLK